MVLHSQRDKGYAWVILVISTLTTFICGYFNSGMGVLLVELEHLFNITKLQLSVITTCYMVIAPITALVLSGMNKKFGPRRTTIFTTTLSALGHIAIFINPSYLAVLIWYGCVSGIGLWMSLSLAFSSVQLYFDKKRSLASGIINCGSALGTFGSIITSSLIDAYAMQGCLLIQAGLLLQGFVFAALYRPLVKDKPKHFKSNEDEHVMHNNVNRLEPETSVSDSNLKEKNILNKGNGTSKKRLYICLGVWRRNFAAYTVFLFGFMLIVMSHYYVYIFTPLRAEDKGLLPHQGALLVTISGVVSAIMRPIFGLIGNLKTFRNKHEVLFGMSCLINGIIILLSTLCQNFWTMSIYMGCYGIGAAGYYGVLSVVIGDLLCTNYADFGSGLLIMCHALAFTISQPVTGMMMDNISTDSPCYLFGTTQIVGGIIIAAIPWCFRRDIMKADIHVIN